MRIVFLGSGEFGLPTLRALRERHEVLAVVSQPDRPAGRKRRLTPTPIAEYALSQGLPIHRHDDVNQAEVIQTLRGYRADAGVVIAFGQKLSPELIGSLGVLAVNLHSSLLPRYRGAAPINWAMIQGDRVTGVSVIGLAQRMDAGEVYATATLDIEPLETAGELHDRLAALGPEAVLRVLDDLERGQLRPIPQDHAQATRAPKLRKEDGTVDFDQPADRVRARVHGLTPWPGCRVQWRRGESDLGVLTIARVRPHPEERGQVAAAGEVLEDHHVATAAGTIELLEVQAPGTRVMPIAEFARGRPILPGDRLTPLLAATAAQ